MRSLSHLQKNNGRGRLNDDDHETNANFAKIIENFDLRRNCLALTFIDYTILLMIFKRVKFTLDKRISCKTGHSWGTWCK